MTVAQLHRPARESSEIAAARPAAGTERTRQRATAQIIDLGARRRLGRGNERVPSADLWSRETPEVRIYRPAASAVQSGRARTRQWVLEFEPASRPVIEPLMGRTASEDPLQQLQLRFPTEAAAVAFAERRGWRYTVDRPHHRAMRPKSYAEALLRDPLGRLPDRTGGPARPRPGPTGAKRRLGAGVKA